jgi:hypothetical protein
MAASARLRFAAAQAGARAMVRAACFDWLPSAVTFRTSSQPAPATERPGHTRSGFATEYPARGSDFDGNFTIAKSVRFCNKIAVNCRTEQRESPQKGHAAEPAATSDISSADLRAWPGGTRAFTAMATRRHGSDRPVARLSRSRQPDSRRRGPSRSPWHHGRYRNALRALLGSCRRPIAGRCDNKPYSPIARCAASRAVRQGTHRRLGFHHPNTSISEWQVNGWFATTT